MVVVFAAPTSFGTDDVDSFLQRTADVREAPLESLHGYRDVVLGGGRILSPEQRVTDSATTVTGEVSA